MLLLIPLLQFVGCTNRTPGRFEVYPVEGNVAVEGKPARGVWLNLHPLNDHLISGHVFPRTRTDASGFFRFTTYESNDGIPLGDYLVTATWQPVSSSDPENAHPDELDFEHLAHEFTDPERTPLRITVRPGSNHLGTLELSLAKVERQKRK